MKKHAKLIADLLTQARMILGLAIAGLGALRGRDALPQVVVAVIVSWITDFLDGPLARSAPDQPQTWTGKHDAEAELATSCGLGLYLVFSRYVAAWIGLGVLLLTLVLWFFHSRAFGWPFYAVPYTLLIATALRLVPLLGWALIAYLLVALVLRYQRVKEEYLPEFFDAVRNLSV
ncbi:MAG: hypothetical protein A2Y73_03550, partial [Chloroflexi bacterium RBG_13_56_8]